MACRLIVSFLVVLACASTYADTDWTQFPDHDKYGIDKSGCVFPFTYQGTVYHDCTNDGSNGDWPWCSHDDPYIGYFKYCYDFHNTTLKCQDSYKVNGKTFQGCANWTTNAPFAKCKTNDDDYPTINCPPGVNKPKSNYPKGRLPKCDPAYVALSPNHTMCYAPNDNCVEIPIDKDQKQAILDVHNSYRGAVGADYMYKLYWDDELAKLALARSLLGGFDHDLSGNRKSTVYQNLNGQNMVYTTDPSAYESMSDLVDQMLGSEKPNFDYGVGCNGGGNCLHYTQAMISNLTRVGCAFVQCPYHTRVESFLTCNYIQSQYASTYMRPYEKTCGDDCKCPDKKDDTGTLCDCGNIVYDQDTQYIDSYTCAVKKLSSRRKKRDSEDETMESKTAADTEKPTIVLRLADYSILNKRKRRGFNAGRHDSKKK